MSIALGSSTIAAAYFGGNALTKIYLGIVEVFSAGGSFSPLSLFSSGEPGAWYDPSDLTTLYQDAAGTTPVTAVEQPVGLMLDKSRGLVLGPELVANGDFSDGTTGWSPQFGATISAVGGELEYTSSTDGGAATSALTCVVGKTYKLSAAGRLGTYSGTNLQIAVSSSSALSSRILELSFSTGSSSLKSGHFTATATTMYVGVRSPQAIAGTGYFDNISVRELPGNHASQSTATSRPVLSARKNWLVGTDVLATQTTTTRALPYVISFYGTGTVTLSGTSTAGPLVGTGTNDRVYLEFTPAAGTLTVTVSGVVTKAQLEVANEAA